jgi:hypothetical protein
MLQAYSQKGIEIIGTAETVAATALVVGWTKDSDGSMQPEYSGSTDVDWNAQVTDTDADGSIMLVDEDGNVWPASQCVFREESAADATSTAAPAGDCQAEIFTPPPLGTGAIV